MAYKIQNRYEHWCSKGKIFTKWFTIKECNTIEEANEWISKQPKVINKLKNEYKINE